MLEKKKSTTRKLHALTQPFFPAASIVFGGFCSAALISAADSERAYPAVRVPVCNTYLQAPGINSGVRYVKISPLVPSHLRGPQGSLLVSSSGPRQLGT